MGSRSGCVYVGRRTDRAVPSTSRHLTNALLFNSPALFARRIAMHASTAAPSAPRRRLSGTQHSHFCKTETANFDSEPQTAQDAFPSGHSSESDPRTSRPVSLAAPPAPPTSTGCARPLPPLNQFAKPDSEQTCAA
jgi:hypothetical protein